MRRSAIVVAYALFGWGLCAMTMGIAMTTMPMERALVAHAIAAPLIFAGISIAYFRTSRTATPLATAATFLAFVMLMDFFVVALAMERSLAMFESLIGTWVPFVSIFAATYLVGLAMRRPSGRAA
jgi:hypothetical protein